VAVALLTLIRGIESLLLNIKIKEYTRLSMYQSGYLHFVLINPNPRPHSSIHSNNNVRSMFFLPHHPTNASYFFVRSASMFEFVLEIYLLFRVI